MTDQQGKGLRVAILSPTFPPNRVGGISSAHYNLALALMNTGANVQAFTYLDREHFPTAAIPVVRGGLLGPGRYLAARIGWAYLRRRDRPGPGFQYRQTLLSAIGVRGLASPLHHFRPHVVITPDHGAPAAKLALPRSARHVFISHHNARRFCDVPFLPNYPRRDAELASKVEQRAIDRAHGVVCPSDYMRDIFAQTYRMNAPMEVIPNVAELGFIKSVVPKELSEVYGIPADIPVVYIPSAASAIKGARFVFELIRRMGAGMAGEIGFFLSGHCPPNLEDELKCLPDNVRVISPGPLPYAENLAHVKACSLCVSPALLESFGMAQLESLACGVPVVSFDTGGNREVVINGKTGALVPMLDLEALIAEAEGLLSNPDRCRQMGAEAQCYVNNHFSPDLLADRFLAFFRKVGATW